MLQLILASIGFVPWVLYIIVTYYSKNFSPIDHMESATGFGWYLASIGFVYLIYKILSMLIHKKKVRFSFWHIIGFSFLHLFIVTISYTSAQTVGGSPFFGTQGASSIVLLGHIASLLIYPLFLAFLWRAVWYSALIWIKWWDSIPLRIRIGAEISIGLFIFGSFLLLFGSFDMYTLNWLLTICGILSIFAIPGWRVTYQDIKNRYIEFEQHESNSGSLIGFMNPRLISAEIAFFIVSFLISVSLINAIRPMPIGWDDLGVYMNFPRIMAINGTLIQWAGVYTWQLITGTGFFWDQIAANAFYVNQLGGILSMVIIASILSIVLEQKDRKYLLSLPLLLAGIYYMMPMTIFQQAKDMKLDPALMMISVSSFGILWYALRSELEKHSFYYLIGLAGCIAGVAFGIKFTTLILIIASLGLIAYNSLGIFGFSGFFFIFLSIFTAGNLWAKMNVWMPVENTGLIDTIAITCGAIGLLSFGWAYWLNWIKKMKVWIISCIIFILGLILGLMPWFIKNGYEAQLFTTHQKSWTIDSLLSWYNESWLNNYSAIYTTEEYTAKRKAQQSSSITSDGKSQNEDFSRYFGQESGLNNYLKLPVNLTFQKNQSWEFTDITFIFFAFLPIILLFVRWRKFGKYSWTEYLFPGFIAIWVIWLIFYYFNKSTGLYFTNLVSDINLPIGYAFIIWWVLISTIVSHFFIQKNEEWRRIQDIIVMVTVYGFLFLISAFGIVWYGVFVYFLFLALIGLAALTFVSYTDHENEDIIWIKVTISILFFLFIFVYIVRSAFPHGWNNLVGAGMNEYKYNKLNQNESIFTYRSDYITPISTMNVVDPSVVVKRAGELASSMAIKKILTPERLAIITPAELHQILLYFKTQLLSGKITQDKKNIEKDIENIGHELYSSILSPKWTDVNNKWSY